jgi:hypothetical protein
MVDLKKSIVYLDRFSWVHRDFEILSKIQFVNKKDLKNKIKAEFEIDKLIGQYQHVVYSLFCDYRTKTKLEIGPFLVINKRAVQVYQLNKENKRLMRLRIQKEKDRLK